MRRSHLAVLAGSAYAVLLAGCDSSRSVDPSVPEASMARSGGELAAPSDATARALSPADIAIGWKDNSSSETGFEIHRSTTGEGGTYSLWKTADANAVTRIDSGLAEGTQYCYRMRSVLAGRSKPAYSAFSNTACATTLVTPPPPPPPPAPAAPSALNPRPASSSDVRLAWTDNASDEDGFRIERSTDAGASWVLAGSVPANFTGFTDAGRQAEAQVCYRVVAFNAGGDGASPGACTIPPAAPTNPVGTQLDSVAYDFQWTDNSAVEDGYEVWAYVSYPPYCIGEVCEAGYSEGEELLATLPANSTAYRCTDCANATALWVRATKDGGHSNFLIWQKP